MSEASERQPSLFPMLDQGQDPRPGPRELSDRSAREFATDPRHNVVLQASAGTGKTSVLVQRYLNLLRADVDPSHVLAITFTRQAAAEMRERIITHLRREAGESVDARERWALLRDRLGEISISTVDAFCLSLLREFPLEADLDPGFGMADETEVPALVESAVERALSIGSGLARDDSGVAMLIAQLGPWRVRAALTHLLERRLVVPSALHRFLAVAPRGLTAEGVCGDACRRLADRIDGSRRHLELMLDAAAPDDPRFAMVARDLRRLPELASGEPGAARSSLDRIREYFLTQKGTERTVFRLGTKLPGRARRRFQESASAVASLVRDGLEGLDRDVNVVMARAVQRLFGIAVSEYQRELESRARLDFSDVLQRAIALLRQMDEFARSRYRLESRYHHVLVDEFQDTSRAQWELVSLLVQAWGEGSGLGDDAPVPPSIFIVGDRKQSIYRFRDADLSVLQTATDAIAKLRPDGDVRRSIAHSFRAVPALLDFVNDLFDAIGTPSKRRDAFTYEAHDRFPTEGDDAHESSGRPVDDIAPGDRPLGVVVADDIETCAATVAAEIDRLLENGLIRAPDGSGARPVRPGDIAILFRARSSHREFDRALERRSIPAYVYKGLGFFDADEVKDVRALIRLLANPASELRAAALLRSRFVRLSDPALVVLASRLSESLLAVEAPAGIEQLSQDDQIRLRLARGGLAEWLDLVDRLPPAEVLDRVLLDTAYARELHGSHVVQARENLKKIRALVRKLQNRGYATMARISDQIDHLSGDLATAVIEAFDAVHLMTVHAAKGLEFPVVFLVDLGRGTGSQAPAVRIVPDRGDGQPSVSVWPYRSDADEDERDRNIEETKRLLYVATTRARDRLYLSTVSTGGSVAFNHGSFGSVLPSGFAPMLESAAVHSGVHVGWQGPSGRIHTLDVLSPADRERRRGAVGEEASRNNAEAASVDISPVILPPDVDRESVTDSLGSWSGSRPEGPSDGTGDGLQALVGQTVHQLMQRFRGRRVGLSILRAEVDRSLWCLRPLDPELAARAAGRSIELYGSVSERTDLRILQDQECLFEIPFSFHDFTAASKATPSASARIVTGTIDCIARHENGQIKVLEFKTGARRSEHGVQLERYVEAVRAMFPDVTVQGQLFYLDERTTETDAL